MHLPHLRWFVKEKASFSLGWIIVAVSFVTLGLAYGVWYSFSVFFVALLREFGWSCSLAADFFEGEAYGGIFRALILLNGFGGASGAWLSGFFHDQVGSYVPVIVIMIACALFACLNIWRAAPRRIRAVPRGVH